MEEKKNIRKVVFAERKGHTDQEIREMSRMITEKVTALPEFKNAERILAYADYNHEVQTSEIIREALRQGKEVAVPKVRGQEMDFLKIRDLSVLEPGYFGIPEPVSGEIADWQDALMVMPGVAFDTENRRVGYGGGFYDRYLEKHPGLYTVALAFEFQIMDQVPFEPTDIRPRVIVTEKRVLD